MLFNEGITLSYAKSFWGVDENNNLIKDYTPFTPFACLSDKTEPRLLSYFMTQKLKKNNYILEVQL